MAHSMKCSAAVSQVRPQPSDVNRSAVTLLYRRCISLNNHFLLSHISWELLTLRNVSAFASYNWDVDGVRRAAEHIEQPKP